MIKYCIIYSMLKFLEKSNLLQKRKRYKPMNKQYKFHKLTPSDTVEMGIYENAMEYIFSNDDIRNIAISGTYGAGKSSMIESYKKIHPNKKFIHISLAHFVSDRSQNSDDDETKSKQVAALEGKIINQLIHQIDSRKIPQTNFRIKKNMDNKHILKVALLVIDFVAITCFFRFHDAWKNMIDGFSIPYLQWIFHFTVTNEMELLLGAAALIILGRAIYEIIKLQKNVKLFRKFNFQGNEIEVFEESKDSYFDKYLNEVLYIFEHTDVDGIIFEDIDRYDTTVIFEKLREINYLLNQRERANGVEEQRTIRFFYLLRDDIFESKDRTKFFDFILPIVPVVDASNAYDKFIDYFKEANLLDLFDMDFVQGLSLYVDDMRILKNICNEFVIYHEKLKTSFTEQSNNKLLAMIVYKNLFPKDFGYLQIGRGYVHTLFADKKKFVADQIKQLEEKIDVLQVENEDLNSECMNNLDELNALYFLIDGRISVDGKEEAGYKTRKEFVKAILTSGNIKRFSYRGDWMQISIDTEKKTMEQNPDYIKRKALIEKKNKAGIEKNNYQITTLKKQMEELVHKYLKDILTRENETAIFQADYTNAIKEVERFEDVKRSPYFDLIKFLIREGYLDETYPDYMTYFYENSITANDKTFLRSITDRHSQPYDYKLDNPALVISRMRMMDFKTQEALNFGLLEQLLSDTEKYKEHIQNFLYTIWNIEPGEFVSQFLDRNIARKEFVKQFNVYWAGANRWILSTDVFTLQQKRRYVIDTLCLSSDKVIIQNNQLGEIKEFIESDAEFLIFDDTDENILENRLNILEERLDLLEIKFRELNIFMANYTLFQYVYNNDMYVLNMDIINDILIYWYNSWEGNNLLCKNLSYIFSDEDQPLYSYVKNNIDLYIGELLSAVQETEDTEEVVLYVLNSSDESITEEHKKAYIASSKTIISNLNQVTDTKWWGELLEQDKVLKTTENLCDYYFNSGNGLDDRLIHFINSFEQTKLLAIADISNNYEKSQKENFFFDIAKCNKIENDRYEELLRTLNTKYIKCNVPGINLDKIAIMIRQNILEMNTDILKTMREHYSEMCMMFIEHNIDKYVEIMNEDIFSSSELMQILEEKIDDELKIRLLKFATSPISIQNKNYSDRIQDYIVENLYCEKDFEYLVQWYPLNRGGLKKQILNIVIAAIQNTEEISCVVHPKLLESLILSERINTADKLALLAQQIEAGIQKGNAKKAFEQLGIPEYKQLLEGKQVKVEATSTEEQLLEALKERKWISDYEEDPEDPEMFLAFGKVTKRREREMQLT